MGFPHFLFQAMEMALMKYPVKLMKTHWILMKMRKQNLLKEEVSETDPVMDLGLEVEIGLVLEVEIILEVEAGLGVGVGLEVEIGLEV